MCVTIYFTGQYIPLCDEDGYYKPTQCHGSVGQCWCVDRYGNEVIGSRINGVADCGKRMAHFIQFPNTQLNFSKAHELVQAFHEGLPYSDY